MKVNTINSYNYNKQNVKQSNKPNFKGRLLLKEPVRKLPQNISQKVFTKRNIFLTTFLMVLTNLALDKFEVEHVDLLTNISKVLLGAFLVMKEKPNLQLEENIEFKKAETLEEAKAFAKEKLGIKNFKIKDLDYANWVNEGLTNVSNRFKGEVYFPHTIKYNEIKTKDDRASYLDADDTIRINKWVIEECAKELPQKLEENSFEELTKYNLGKGYDEFCTSLKKAYVDIDLLDVFEKASLSTSIARVKYRLERLDDEDIKEITEDPYNEINRFGNVYEGRLETIYHEVGHCFDDKSNRMAISLYNRFFSKDKIKLKYIPMPKYAKTSTNEFVACTFAGIMQGEKYKPEVMDMFNKLIKFKMCD